MTGTAADRTRWTDWLQQRWPTAVAIGSAALILRDAGHRGWRSSYCWRP